MKQNNHILSNETINLISESVKEAINELISQETNDKNFHIWKNTFNAYLKEEIQELQENYLDKLGLKIKINDNYNFNTRGKRKWLGKQINLYHDDLTYDEGAVYTYDYIPPQCISIYQTLEI